MSILMVVGDPKNWPLSINGVQVVAARKYLTDPAFHRLPNTRLFNLCQSYSYQSLGYYVSLLAEARSHKPEPDVTTIQDMKSTGLIRAITEDLDELIQRTLRTVQHDEFTLSIYFGKTLADRDRQLGARLFGRFRSPLLRAQFVRKEKWLLQSIRPIPASEIPPSHHKVVIAGAEEYFARKFRSGRASQPVLYRLAILRDPAEIAAPSNEAALRRFVRAAQRHGLGAELIDRDDFDNLGEFDALFIRATTHVNHYTYRFARRATAEGLVVIDDPLSIARCSNKVYLAERMALHHIPTPRTVIVQRDNVDQVIGQLGLPLVLKQPDGAFSQGVVKIDDPRAYHEKIEEMLDKSDAVIAQEFMPSDYDWRIGVLDGKPLFACKYYMAAAHWQIVKHEPGGRMRYGKSHTVPLEDVPRAVVAMAVRAARLIGDGLYGVDLKAVGRNACVIEVNDNPNIDAGVEDQVLKEELYDRIIQSFVRRIEHLRTEANGRAKRTRVGAV